MTKFTLIVAAICTFGSTLPAQAQPMTAIVKYSDLDLTAAEGRQRLDQRIEEAVDRVCPPYDGSLHARVIQGKCKAKALADAQGQARLAIATRENHLAVRSANSKRPD